MICPNCHSENRTNARFCDTCGQELPSVAFEATQMFGSNSVYVNNGSNISINLEGLEQMIDSSHDPQAFESSSTVDLDAVPFESVDSYGSYETVRIGVNTPYPSYDENLTRAIPPQNIGMTQAFSSSPSASRPTNYSDANYQLGDKKGTKKPLIIGIVSAVVIVAFLAAAYLLQFWGGATVPDVLGMYKTEAIEAMQDAGFEVKVVNVKSDDVEGIVLSTDPEPMKRAESGSTVILNVSIPRTIPDIVGMVDEDAAALLQSEGFTNIEYAEEKSDAEVDTVVRVDPEVGTRSKADSKVIVYVAIPHVVPDVAGLDEGAAKVALEEEGYVVETTYVYTEDVSDGQPISTDPVAGTQLASGSKVILNLAKNRSKEVESLAKDYFNAISKFRINGQDYEMRSISSIKYLSDNKCAFSIVARPYETHSWFGVEMETRYGNEETIDGTITYNDSNQVIAIDPAIKQGG